MNRMRHIGVWILLLLLWAPAPQAADILEVYVREGCPHCASAKQFLAEYGRQHPELTIVYRAIDRDPQAREALMTISEQAGVWPPGVPTFVHKGEVMVGHADGQEGARTLRAFIEHSPVEQHPGADGRLAGLSVTELGLPLFTLAVGLLDGFNPCATWVLLFLLSLLVRLRSRRRMAVIAGTFVLASGLVYYAFMAAWLNLFLFTGLSAAVRVALALVALAIGLINLRDGLSSKARFTLAIPEAAKTGLYTRMRRLLQSPGLLLSLPAVVMLAVIVNFVELLCTAGFPALYTAILTRQEIGEAAYYGYLGLYILAYMADDALMVGLAVLALGDRRLGETGARRLKLLSGGVMGALGLVLLLRPEWLF